MHHLPSAQWAIHPSAWNGISRKSRSTILDICLHRAGGVVASAPSMERGGGILSGSFLRRRLRSGSAWAFGGRIGGAMFGIVTNALVMRMLPTDPERNAYVLALSIVSLGAVVGSLGLPKT